MSRYMLDTDTASYAMKKSNDAVLRRLAEVPVLDVRISAISKAELSYGIAVSPNPARDAERLRFFLQFITVEDFTGAMDEHYGTIRADLKIRGQMIGANDLFIGAHARFLGLTLVTNNIREFSRIPGLKLENWAE
jgi:tRNA(fMet)-specific endonuclease VapC